MRTPKPLEQHVITAPMLHTLAAHGPGTLITAYGALAPYQVRPTREVDLNTLGLVIAYGHGDLRQDLHRHQGDWERIAIAATQAAAREHHRLFFQPPSPLGRALREDLHRHGMLLDRRPEVSRTEDGARRLDDHLTWAQNPRITLTLSTFQRHRDSLMIRLEMYDHDHYVRCWPERTTVTSGTPACVREAPARIQRHLDLRP